MKSRKTPSSEPREAPAPLKRSRLSEAQESAIFEAALGLVAEVGYDNTSMDEIARRAHASKATLYRRWNGKDELVFAAFQQRNIPPPTPPTCNSLRDDFIQNLGFHCQGITAQQDLIVGLLPAIRANPELARASRERMLRDGQGIATSLLQRAVDRGELSALPESFAALAEVATALVFHRLLFTGAPLDDAFVHPAVDAILLPLIGASPIRRATSSPEQSIAAVPPAVVAREGARSRKRS